MKGFFTGVAVGFGVGLLLAPEQGSETRKKVIERLKAAKDDLPESARPLVESVTEGVEQLRRTTLEPAAERIQPLAESLKDEAARLLEVFNTASKTKLMSVSGIGDATARRIIDGRPYDSADAIVGDGVLSEDVLRNLKKELLEPEAAA
jgi:gas vesicle protein